MRFDEGHQALENGREKTYLLCMLRRTTTELCAGFRVNPANRGLRNLSTMEWRKCSAEVALTERHSRKARLCHHSLDGLNPRVAILGFSIQRR
jgi:hypothetical protein